MTASNSNPETYKAIILLGGPAKSTRFRPLSMDQPKPLFSIGGYPIIYHHVEACSKVPGMKEILLIGYYPREQFCHFVDECQQQFGIKIRYLQEFTPLGTAGGLFHFRDQIMSGEPAAFFVMNSDVCCDFQLEDMLAKHRPGTFTIMCTEATRSQSVEYGCAVIDRSTDEILHYVEKPATFVSNMINCGLYILSPSIFVHLKAAVKAHYDRHFNFDLSNQCSESVHMEKEVFQPLASQHCLFAYVTKRFWSQVKSAGAAIYANRHVLDLYRSSHPTWLAAPDRAGPRLIGDVYIHPSASVSPTAVLGPNVSIDRYATIGEGVRLRDCIVLQGGVIREHACVMFSVIGTEASIGEWARIEGTPTDPNPNKPFAKIKTLELFNERGQLNPSCTVIGSHVEVPAEVIVRNSIVLPHKELDRSYRNQIIM
uniref:NTP_transferase domain-containing protein n=2 Tax=Macrostomum lignano TaxID=282301 RepID=A0A1I8GSF9_9PLAT